MVADASSNDNAKGKGRKSAGQEETEQELRAVEEEMESLGGLEWYQVRLLAASTCPSFACGV